ncbi:MAG: hypothetical protein KKF48_04045 [Nanoarchaeota archaeon]|nr:hypothetical protein [Nanoarchaeota archaeon]MBU1028190.1 hypothetical protein [Nanoarchaeota archaeon]
MFRQKAELTTQQIVILVIIIASFAVILFLLFRLNFGGETDKELCHNSVVMRSNSIVPTDTIPLKCKTSYICISEDGSCESMTRPEIKKVKTKEEIFEVLADEMADCWWMFGGGKVDYIGDDWVDSDLYCSICSQIAFDNSVKEIGGLNSGSFNEEELYSYLEGTKIEEGGSTYIEYLHEGQKDKYVGEYKDIDLSKQHYVVMGIWSETNRLAAVGTGIGLIAGGLAAAKFTGGGSLVGVKVGIALIAGAAVGGAVVGGAGYYVGATFFGESGNQFLRPTILEANSEEFNALDCYEVSTLA